MNDSIAAACSTGIGRWPLAILLTNDAGTPKLFASAIPRPLSAAIHDFNDIGRIVLPNGKDIARPKGKFQHAQPERTIRPMQTVHETRRARLALLLEKYRTFAAINEALEWPRTDSRLSRIRNANTRTDRQGKVFQMGDAIAREVESKLNLPEGWMDTPLTYAELHQQEDPRAKVLELMERMPASEWATVVRLVDALAQPVPERSNGTK